MVPALKVKFRKRKGIPYAVERLSGTQYRCRACNRVFLEREELDSHLNAKTDAHNVGKPSGEAPKLNENLLTRVIYIQDIIDSLKKDYIKHDEYDDPGNEGIVPVRRSPDKRNVCRDAGGE